MDKTLKISAAFLLLVFAPIAFACDYPQRVQIPNGATATKDEMLEGQRAVKTFMADMEIYLACIDEEEQATVDTMDEELTEEDRVNREAALNKKHNAAVEDMELVAARFNEAVGAWRAQDD